MKIKVAEATNNQIDWLVANCEYRPRQFNPGKPIFDGKVYETEGLKQIGVSYNPSNNWNIAGPIIEREIANLSMVSDWKGIKKWAAIKFEYIGDGTKVTEMHGETILIAAMRCYVVSKIGDEVEIPDDIN